MRTCAGDPPPPTPPSTLTLPLAPPTESFTGPARLFELSRCRKLRVISLADNAFSDGISPDLKALRELEVRACRCGYASIYT